MTIDPKNVLRLNLPQWQGGDRPDYWLGAQVLAAIAPEPQGPVETIAVPRSAEDNRPVDGGIVSREALLDQLTAARSAIARHQPEAIVTLGGDCLIDLAPIAYLSERYGDDLAVVWVDAHPDVMGPAQFQNAHAHVLAILMGEGDSDFIAAVCRPLDPRRILYVGLTETTPFETGFIASMGLLILARRSLRYPLNLSSPGCDPRVASGWRFISMSTCWIPPIATSCCSATRPSHRMRSKAWPEDVCALPRSPGP